MVPSGLESSHSTVPPKPVARSHQRGKFGNGKFFAGAYVDVGVAYFAAASGGHDVGEANVEEYMHAGVGHILAPEKFAQGRPEPHRRTLRA